MRTTKWFLLPVSAALLALLPACTSMAEEKDDDEEDENSTPITIDQVPAAVRKTIEAQAAGNKLEELEREVEKGETVYEAEFTIAGKTYEITVGEDGTLISKEDETDDDDDDDDEDEADDQAGKKS